MLSTVLSLRDWTRDRERLATFLVASVSYPRVFATLSGGDLYGFPSDDGDYDLRGAHLLPMQVPNQTLKALEDLLVQCRMQATE